MVGCAARTLLQQQRHDVVQVEQDAVPVQVLLRSDATGTVSVRRWTGTRGRTRAGGKRACAESSVSNRDAADLEVCLADDGRGVEELLAAIADRLRPNSRPVSSHE